MFFPVCLRLCNMSSEGAWNGLIIMTSGPQALRSDTSAKYIDTPFGMDPAVLSLYPFYIGRFSDLLLSIPLSVCLSDRLSVRLYM